MGLSRAGEAEGGRQARAETRSSCRQRRGLSGLGSRDTV